MSKIVNESKLIHAITKFIDEILSEQEGATTISITEFVTKTCDGIAQAVKALNGGAPQDKISGRVKSEILVHYQQKFGLDFEIKQSDLVESWMASAKSIYIMLYSSRRDPEILVEATSRMMRKLPVFKHLDGGVERIHYRPQKEIIRRLYSFMWGLEKMPDPTSSMSMSHLLDLNGNVYVYDMCPVTIEDYHSGLVEAVPKFDLEKIR